MKYRELWILYNHAHNIDRVASIKPNLNSNRFAHISEYIHAIEHRAYTDLKQQADMLYEALEAAKTAVTYAHADLMDEYYLDAKRYFDRTLKTYESFIEESEK